MKHTFENIEHPIDLDGIGRHYFFSVTIDFDAVPDDDTIGYVPCGDGQVFHPGGGVCDVVADSTVQVTGVCFSDEDDDCFYEWVDGTFEDAPSPMPLTAAHLTQIFDEAARYASRHLDDIELF